MMAARMLQLLLRHHSWHFPIFNGQLLSQVSRGEQSLGILPPVRYVKRQINKRDAVASFLFLLCAIFAVVGLASSSSGWGVITAKSGSLEAECKWGYDALTCAGERITWSDINRCKFGSVQVQLCSLQNDPTLPAQASSNASSVL